MEWPLKLPLITAKRPLQPRKGKIPQQKWTGNTKKTMVLEEGIPPIICFNMESSGMFWVYMVNLGKPGKPPKQMKQVFTWARCEWPSPTVPRVCDRTTMGKKGKGWWRSGWEVDVDLVVSGKIIYRENGGTLGMVPYIPNKYPLYKVYMGLIIKGTIPRVAPFSLWIIENHAQSHVSNDESANMKGSESNSWNNPH